MSKKSFKIELFAGISVLLLGVCFRVHSAVRDYGEA